ncbi:MAG: hypothetical protein NZ533_08085 [Casimicrobiaceae bacterium]|nr:hypothetical protein [Casimicrobiaceae bacterium]MDW8312596.1 hypothetical protein [Burkholderiales bacterium]
MFCSALRALGSLLVCALATLGMARGEELFVELRHGCRVSGIPAAPRLTVSWVGGCREGRAEGLGELFAFVDGRPHYILRGEFLQGRLVRQESLRDCSLEACVELVAPAMLAQHLREAERLRLAARSASPPGPGAGGTPSTPPAPSREGLEPVVPSTLPAAPPVAPAIASEVPERRIEVPNAVFIGRFTLDERDRSVSGRGRVEYADGGRYEGDIVRGRKEGRGIYRWPSGMRYEGEWLADRPHGHGLLTYPNGDVYEGSLVAGEREGTGTLREAGGDTYTGNWQAGRRNGQGVAVFANGQRYEGTWRDDRKHGKGVMLFPDGSRYEGDWVDDQAIGEADLWFVSGDAYTGEVRNGMPHGRGIYRWGSGDRFEGEFENGKPTQRGRMFFAIEAVARPEPAVASPPPPATTPAPPPPATPAPAAVATVAPATSPTPNRTQQCFAAFNAAQSQAALRRFLEQFPDDECERHAIARQKLAALAERERQAARALEERQALARSFIGATVAFTQEFPFCVVGVGPDCQRVTYTFNVTAKIREIDVQRRTAVIQVAEVTSLGQRGTPHPLFAQGRAAATEAFRARMVGSTQTRTLSEIGLAF